LTLHGNTMHGALPNLWYQHVLLLGSLFIQQVLLLAITTQVINCKYSSKKNCKWLDTLERSEFTHVEPMHDADTIWVCRCSGIDHKGIEGLDPSDGVSRHVSRLETHIYTYLSWLSLDAFMSCLGSSLIAPCLVLALSNDCLCVS